MSCRHTLCKRDGTEDDMDDHHGLQHTPSPETTVGKVTEQVLLDKILDKFFLTRCWTSSWVSCETHKIGYAGKVHVSLCNALLKCLFCCKFALQNTYNFKMPIFFWNHTNGKGLIW